MCYFVRPLSFLLQHCPGPPTHSANTRQAPAARSTLSQALEKHGPIPAGLTPLGSTFFRSLLTYEDRPLVSFVLWVPWGHLVQCSGSDALMPGRASKTSWAVRCVPCWQKPRPCRLVILRGHFSRQFLLFVLFYVQGVIMRITNGFWTKRVGFLI